MHHSPASLSCVTRKHAVRAVTPLPKAPSATQYLPRKLTPRARCTALRWRSLRASRALRGEHKRGTLTGKRTGSTTTTLLRRRRPLSSGALARSSTPVGSAAARCEQLSIAAE